MIKFLYDQVSKDSFLEGIKNITQRIIKETKIHQESLQKIKEESEFTQNLKYTVCHSNQKRITQTKTVYYNQRKSKDSNPYKEAIMEFLSKKVKERKSFC